MSRPPHSRPQQALCLLVEACVLMQSAACSTTLDPTLDLGKPELSGANAGASGALGGARDDADPPVIPISISDCPVSSLGDHQYSACNKLRSFAEASADCAKAGTVLIKVDGVDETALLKGLAFPGRAWGWIGADRDEKFNWSWLDGTPFWHGEVDGTPEPGAYTNWQKGEPNNTSETVRKEEACGTFNVGEGAWVDRYCDLVLPYICELSAPGSATGNK